MNLIAAFLRCNLIFLELIFNILAGYLRRLQLPMPNLSDLAGSRLPLVGSFGGSVVAHPPRFKSSDLNIPPAMALAPAITRFIVDDLNRIPGNVGQIVKAKFFPDAPGFTVNVCFLCGKSGIFAPGKYANPHSIWFNVFAGYYEITVACSEWNRPFAYRFEGDQAMVDFADIVRLGKADWNYFSNYLYGVPLGEIEPFDAVEMGQVKCRYFGREQLTNEQDDAKETTRAWDAVEIDNVEVVSAYLSGQDGKKLKNPSLLTPLWRLAFGKSNPSPEYPLSFIPTTMKARLYLCFDKAQDPQFGEIYRTFIFGGTINQNYPDQLLNERFLELQIKALRQTINYHHPNLGFLPK